MISVAMALYNSMKYIEQQLDSIRLQTNPVDEVIMVDDCSTDHTITVVCDYIKQYELQNWKVIRHIENKGYIETFYDAIDHCSGDVIILSDHDDVWLSNKVSIISDTFEKNDRVLALATSFVQIDENGKEVPVQLKPNHANNNLIRKTVEKGSLNKMSFYDIAIYNLAPGCTCAFRANLKEHLTERRKVLPHDWAIMTIASCYDGLYYLDVVTTQYRIYSGNTIGLGHENRYEKRVKTVANNCKEKNEMLGIIEQHKGKNSDEYRYAAKILNVFLARKGMLEKRNIFSGIFTFFKSIPYGRLYESVAMDILTFIKG